MFKILKYPAASTGHGLWKCLPCSFRKFSRSSDSGQNYYEVLGLEKNATPEEIKKAYYSESMKHHPDKKQGNQDRFREISSAYEVLGNIRLRKMYDRGIISGGSSTVYESYSHTMTETDSPPPPDSDSISIPALDQWSKEHYSQTFRKEQKFKRKREEDAKFKAYKDDAGAGMGIMFGFMVAVIISGFIVELQSKENKERRPRS